MKLSRRKVLLGLGLLVLGLLVLVWTLRSRAVARYQRQLLAAGEKLKLEELLPSLTPLDKNGAPLFNQTMGRWASSTNLLEKNPPLAMHMIAPGKAMVGWAQPDIRSDRTNTWSEVETAFARYREPLAMVRAAAERPVLDFNLNYRQGYTLPLPHLAPLKNAVQRLMTAALCDLRRGDTAAAGTNIQTMLALVKGMTNERLAISQLVRIAMAQISQATTWELLQSPHVADDQLAAIQRDWTELKFTQPAEDSLAMERAIGQMMLERMRNSSSQFRQVLSLGGGPAGPSFSLGQAGNRILGGIVARTKEAQWRLLFSYPDQLRTLKGYQVLLESIRMVQAGQPFEAAFSRQRARLTELGLQPTNEEFKLFFNPSDPDLRSLFSGSVVSFNGMLKRVFEVEAAREMTITAIALKRYQLCHGQYPAELSALVPEFLQALPRDPADGQPLRYRLKPDGTFLLYSIGQDGIDNGGDVSPAAKSESFTWQNGRDFVWPAPATPEEVSGCYYQKNEKKHGR